MAFFALFGLLRAFRAAALHHELFCAVGWLRQHLHARLVAVITLLLPRERAAAVQLGPQSSAAGTTSISGSDVGERQAPSISTPHRSSRSSQKRARPKPS